ncbi:MAG: GIY-YIG nuclease family protein [bacterium]|nr:GIY-YIG nuclease family protein [bacterium]
MYYTYIIKSERTLRYYIGSTSNIDDRLRHHNSGANGSTRPYRPWQLVHVEEFETKRGAWLREHQIKRYKGGEAFKKLVGKK